MLFPVTAQKVIAAELPKGNFGECTGVDEKSLQSTPTKTFSEPDPEEQKQTKGWNSGTVATFHYSGKES